MDNSIQHLAEHILLVASPKVWVESTALDQLHTAAKLAGMCHIVGLPDLHAGRDYPIGAAFFAERLYPCLIGGDIGCGMALWQTDLKQSRLNLDKLAKRIGCLDKRLDTQTILQLNPQLTPIEPFGFACGTIGLGNHFAELLVLDTLYQPDTAHQIGLAEKALQLLIHSGSRGIGQEILTRHLAQYGQAGFAENESGLATYWFNHQQALAYAAQNRELIARRILANLKSAGVKLVDIPHNFVEKTEINGEVGWLHRKGAAPSDQGLVIIPGSRGSYSYLVKPVATDIALRSLAHGAGRKWKRRECKARLLDHFSASQFMRTALGSRVVCQRKALLYEEAPQAYKNIDTIIDALQQAGLIELVARFKPVLTYKTQQEAE